MKYPYRHYVVGDKEYIEIIGYSIDTCLDLIENIENLNNGEGARIILEEKALPFIFDNYNKFNYPQLNITRTEKIGIHDVVVNDKMIDRYRKYFNVDWDHFLLICSSEFGTVGIIFL